MYKGTMHRLIATPASRGRPSVFRTRFVSPLVLLVLCFIFLNLSNSLAEDRIFLFNALAQVTSLGEGDGLMLVDFWSDWGCPSKTQAFTEFVETTAAPLTRAARRTNVTVIHALSGSSQTANLTDPAIRSRFWRVDKSTFREGKKLVRTIKEMIKQRSRRTGFRSPLPTAPVARRGPPNCPGKDMRMHPGISFDADRDYLLDDGVYFDRLSKIGIKRLFYSGAYLEHCVMFTRLFSATPAAWSKEFDEIGVILDATLPGKACLQDCKVRFARWVRKALGRSSISFWTVSNGTRQLTI